MLMLAINWKLLEVEKSKKFDAFKNSTSSGTVWYDVQLNVEPVV